MKPVEPSAGVPAQAAELVAGFQRRCPVYGSLAVASGHVEVRHETEPGTAVASAP